MSKTNTRRQRRAAPAPTDSQSIPERAEIPARVVESIAAGRYDAACSVLQALPRSTTRRHLLGVCLIRSGRVVEAVDVFKSLCLNHGTTVIRIDADDVLKINYATAILMAGIPSGAVDILYEVRDHGRPEEVALWNAIKRWEKSLSFWRRLDWKLSRVYLPGTNVPIDGTLGILPLPLPPHGLAEKTVSDPFSVAERLKGQCQASWFACCERP